MGEMIKPTERAQDTAVLYQQYSDSSDFPPSIFETIKSKTDPDNAGFFYDNLLDQINKALSNNLRSTQNGLNFQQNGFDEITTILIHLTDGEARDPQNRQQAVIDQLIQRVDIRAAVAVGEKDSIHKSFKAQLLEMAADEDHIFEYTDYSTLGDFAHEIIQLIQKDCEALNSEAIFPQRRSQLPVGRVFEHVDSSSSWAFDSDMSQDFLSYEKYTDTRNDNRHRN